MAVLVFGVVALHAQAMPEVVENLKAAEAEAVSPPLLALPVEAPAKVDAQIVQLPSAQEVSDMRVQLQEKDELIAKLTKHLESALVRLNKTQTPLTEASASVAALRAAKAQLEKQNEALKIRQQQLMTQNAELERKKQVLDLENRQLFQALNGRPVVEGNDFAVEKVAKKPAKPQGAKNLVLGQ